MIYDFVLPSFFFIAGPLEGFRRSIARIFFSFFPDTIKKDRNCRGCASCCPSGCYKIWLKFQNCLLMLVYDTVFDFTVTLCIILNTAFLAVEHHGMSEDLKHVLEIGNQVRHSVS